MKILMREGFWYNKKEGRLLPKPIANDKPWKGKKKFLEAFQVMQEKVYDVRAADTFKGSSICRICKKPNSSSQIYFRGWTWPNGLRHYVEKHNVRPSLAFQEFILGHYVKEA